MQWLRQIAPQFLSLDDDQIATLVSTGAWLEIVIYE
jgi:hypothetical protein